MNKQEFINKLKKLLTKSTNDFDNGHDYGIRKAVLLAEDLDEPVKPPEPKPLELEKPVVPQFVADWYEEHKYNFEFSVQCLCFQDCEPERQIDNWFDSVDNKPIETLVMMHKFGYEVEKEKLYTVELPNPNGDSNMYGLCKVDGRIIIGTFVFGLNKASNAKLTEAEIKKDFDWAWEFAEEVKE